MAKTILHMITPQKHMSPFDVNMAVDAGFDVVVPYEGVELQEVRGLVQDAIFSRSPANAVKTGFFIGGKSAGLALDMMKTAVESFVPPFAINVFADPAGSFTTAAGMVASAEWLLAGRFGTDLKSKRVVIYGGTGVVAYSAAVIAALQGASVVITGYDGPARVTRIAADMKTRFGVDVEAADGSSGEKNLQAASGAHVIFSAGPAGVRILDETQIAAIPTLLVAADVNAVPPSGIAGIDAMANGSPIAGAERAVALGALAIGNVKYQAQHLLFKRMIETETPLALDFRHAFDEARRFLK